jgi:hypothetical protein
MGRHADWQQVSETRKCSTKQSDNVPERYQSPCIYVPPARAVRMHLLLASADFRNYVSTIKMEALCSSEMSGSLRTTQLLSPSTGFLLGLILCPEEGCALFFRNVLRILLLRLQPSSAGVITWLTRPYCWWGGEVLLWSVGQCPDCTASQ